MILTSTLTSTGMKRGNQEQSIRAAEGMNKTIKWCEKWIGNWKKPLFQYIHEKIALEKSKNAVDIG